MILADEIEHTIAQAYFDKMDLIKFDLIKWVEIKKSTSIILSK